MTCVVVPKTSAISLFLSPCATSPMSFSSRSFGVRLPLRCPNTLPPIPPRPMMQEVAMMLDQDEIAKDAIWHNEREKEEPASYHLSSYIRQWRRRLGEAEKWF